MPLSTDLERAQRTRELLTNLLEDPRQLGPDYQPIHRLSDGRLIGYKATGRGTPGTDLADTLSLLDHARTLGYVERLDWAFRALAVEDMLKHPDLELHVTPEPETFGMPVTPRLASIVARGRREMRRVAELHQDAFADGVATDVGVAEIRAVGARISITDLADDETARGRAAVLRPDIVQLDLRLPGRAKDVGHPGVRDLLAMAADCGAEIMAIGVDSPSDRTLAVERGAAYARGALFGQPGPLPAT